ncbi:hypothetical protein MMPV_007774 [Pyropia vietnamensis]
MAWWSNTSSRYVEVKVAAFGLRGRLLDPFAALLTPSSPGHWEEVARTEIVYQDANPAWVTSFELPLRDATDATRAYKVAVASYDGRKGPELSKHPRLGGADFTLDRILDKRDGVIERVLRDKTGKVDERLGCLILCGEVITRMSPPHMFNITLGITADADAAGPKGLHGPEVVDPPPPRPRKGRRASLPVGATAAGRGGREEHLGGRPGRRGSKRISRGSMGGNGGGVVDAKAASAAAVACLPPGRKVFYVLYRAIVNGVADEDWTPVYRSEVISCAARDGLAATTWECASLSAERLYGNNENRGLRFEFFHYGDVATGGHVPLGFVQTSASAFKFARPGGKLFMVPVPLSGLKRGVVSLDTLKLGLASRKGGLSSVFILHASSFVWGRRSAFGGVDPVWMDNWVDRDAYGRKRVIGLEEEEEMAAGSGDDEDGEGREDPPGDSDGEGADGKENQKTPKDMPKVMPRGISYMGSRAKRLESARDVTAVADQGKKAP